MTDKPDLPLPPEFPASNASYNKIVDKMHKAALNAATATAAISAVEMCASLVKGVNTYAKASRRYADKLVTALSAGFPETPGLVDKTGAASMAADIEAADAKPDVIARAVTAHKQRLAAKKALDPQPKPALALAADGKVFSNKSNAKRALKTLALDHLPVSFVTTSDGMIQPVVSVADDKGAAYAAERGIAAKVLA